MSANHYNPTSSIKCESSYPLDSEYKTYCPTLKNDMTKNKEMNEIKSMTTEKRGLEHETMHKFEYIVDMNVETYLSGHKINGKVYYPLSGYIYLVWKTLAKMNGCQKVEQFPVCFENIQFLNTIPIEGKKLFFTVSVNPKTGLFEVRHLETLIATGSVFSLLEKNIDMPLKNQVWSTIHKQETLTQEEIYKLFRENGYECSTEFQPILKSDIEGTYGELVFTTGYWNSFLTGMIQMNRIGKKKTGLYLTGIKYIKIDPRVHHETKQNKTIVPCKVNYLTNTTVCYGVEMQGLVWSEQSVQKLSLNNEIKSLITEKREQEIESNNIPTTYESTYSKINKDLTKSIETQVLEYYVNECRLLTTHIQCKIEWTGMSSNVYVPTPVPKSWEHEHVKINASLIPVIELINGGKFLQLLIKAVNMDSTDRQYFNKVFRLFNEKSCFLRTLESDLVLNFLEKTGIYTQNFEQFLIKFNSKRQCEHRVNYLIDDESDNEDYQRLNTMRKVKGENVLKVKETLSAIKKITDEVINQQILSNQERILGNNGLLTILNGQIRKPSFQIRKFEEQTKICFLPTQTYIVNCGNGQFCLELVQWIVENGARNVVLVNETVSNNMIRQITRLEEQYGAQIRRVSYDLTDLSECMLLFKEARLMSIENRIGGAFFLDLYPKVLDVNPRENMIQLERQREVRKLECDNLIKVSEIYKTLDESALFVVITNCIESDKTTLVNFCSTLCRQGKFAMTVDYELIGGEYTWWNEFNCGCEIRTENTFHLQKRVKDCLNNLERVLLKNIDLLNMKMFYPTEKVQISWEQKEAKNLFELIANICRINIEQFKVEKMTLGDFNIDSKMISQIKNYLDQYICLNSTEILKLTYRIVNLIEELKWNPTILEQVVRNLIKCNIPERLVINKKINYLMPSKVVEKLNDIEFTDSLNQIPVVVIHPIEGHVNMLKGWAKNMKFPVYGIQYTREAMQYETIEQLANFYWQQIEQNLGQTRVHLCGYSFGSLIAMEMVARLSSRVASFTLLDGSNVFLNRNRYGYENEVETEIEALYTFALQYLQTLSKREFVQNLITMSTFDERIRYVVRELITKSQFQFEPIDLEHAARSYVKKMIMLNKYQPIEPLRLREILVIRPGQLNDLVQRRIEEENLITLFNGKLNIQRVDGDIRSFLEGNNGFNVACILNENLNRFF